MNKAYTRMSKEMMDDLAAVWPNLFCLDSITKDQQTGLFLIKFGCSQLPNDLSNKTVTFEVKRINNKPVVTFREV